MRLVVWFSSPKFLTVHVTGIKNEGGATENYGELAVVTKRIKSIM